MTAIYARQSVDRPDSISIETQLERCRESLTAKELADCRAYIDRGFSGKNTDRPAFQRLLADLRAGGIDRIAVYKLDRVSRSVHDFAGLCDLLRERRVAFRSCEDGLTLDDTPAGTAMAQIMMVFAQFERETIQRRVTDNYYERAKTGMYLGGRPPFGFSKGQTLVGGRKTACYVPDEAQAAVVRALYDRYLEADVSLGTLMRWLNDEMRLPTGRGGTWSTVQLGRLLHSPAYVRADAAVYRYLRGKGAIPTDPAEAYAGTHGCYLYAGRAGRTRSKFAAPAGAFLSLAPHEGLVGAEIWLRAQHKLDAGKALKNSGRGSHSWLSGLMKCAHCGYAVTVVAAPGGAGHYINCGGRKKGRAICPGRTRVTTLEEIEAAAAPALLAYLEGLSGVALPAPARDRAAHNRLEAQIAAAEQELDRLTRNLSLVEQADVVRLLAEKAHETQAALDRLRDEQRALDAAAAAKAAPPLDDVARRWPRFSLEEKKHIARAALSRVVVGDGTVELVFRAPPGGQ
ncbi:MAG: recombinase family protein [Eubacteriales bacterium]|nr:recombinase family protein [Eubacteriales bacterium]